MNKIVKKSFYLICLFLNNLSGTHDDYNLIIIGAGAAGLTAAQIASDFGKKVLLIEKKIIGGGRIWSGDIPFKALFKNAEVLYNASHLNTIKLNLDLNSISRKKELLLGVRTVRDNIYTIIKKDIENQKKVTVKFGLPYFINENTLQLGKDTFRAKHIIIATGASAFVPLINGIDKVDYLSRENFFDLKKIPQSLIIIGGGPLGIEMASGLSKVGVKVTLIMKHGILLPIADFELIQMLTNILIESGVTVCCDMNATAIEQKDKNSVIVSAVNRAGTIYKYEAERVFFATGSKPNINELFLEKAGIKYTQKGIVVNDHLQTTNPHVYAIGDVVGAVTLSRVAYYHAKATITNLYQKQKNKQYAIDYKSVPRVIFSQPLFAFLGLTEQEAYKFYGQQTKVYRYKYTLLEKAHIDQNTQGMAKFICSPDGVLVGAHILGASAGDIIDVMKLGHHFSDTFFEEVGRIRTSPSYFDLIPKVTYLCEKDFSQKHIKKNFFDKIFNTIFWWTVPKNSIK